MNDSKNFLSDSLFCEWAYIINIDTNCLEIYQGFNEDESAPGRYASLKKDCDGDRKYYGVALLIEISFDKIRLMSTEEFLDCITKNNNQKAHRL